MISPASGTRASSASSTSVLSAMTRKATELWLKTVREMAPVTPLSEIAVSGMPWKRESVISSVPLSA